MLAQGSFPGNNVVTLCSSTNGILSKKKRKIKLAERKRRRDRKRQREREREAERKRENSLRFKGRFELFF